MPEQQPAPHYSYEDAERIRRESKQLDEQLARIIEEARDEGLSAARIARDLGFTEGRVHQILRKLRAATEQE
ncbi:sigma factor-like helix-turn-helix DNA-binding protein [Kitasatospora sp. NPDC001574]